jgi:hypothetical protein
MYLVQTHTQNMYLIIHTLRYVPCCTDTHSEYVPCCTDTHSEYVPYCTDTHSGYVRLTAFLRRLFLRKRASLLRCSTGPVLLYAVGVCACVDTMLLHQMYDRVFLSTLFTQILFARVIYSVLSPSCTSLLV